MTLSEIRRHLEKLKVHPSRRLGQNFLHDQNVAARIVELASIPQGARVVEIGPGLGALTHLILKHEPELHLLEMDHRLAAFLQEQHPSAHLLQGDAMETLSALQNTLGDSIVMGNLPYSVGSPIMVQLAESGYRPTRMVFTIQKEVADRLAAKPKTSDFGVLSLLIQPFYTVQVARKLPASVFWPKPEVESTVVLLERKPTCPFQNEWHEKNYRDLVHQAFQKRRKTLGAILGERLPANFDSSRRPEELEVMEWIALAIPPSTTDPLHELFDVVNERDEVVGKEKRGEVHRRHLLHRAVHIFVRNRKNELLLQKRSLSKDVAPGTWDSSAAGHLGSGEDYDLTAAREIQEELGVQIPLSFLEKFSACQELGWEFVCLYEGKSEGPFQFPEKEISEVRWWKDSEITRAIQKKPGDFAPSFRHIWSHTLQKK